MSKDKESTVCNPLAGDIAPRRFIVVDLESKDGASEVAGFTRPFMAGVYDGKEFIAFTDTTRAGGWDQWYYAPGGCVDRAMRWLLQRNHSGSFIYAHNGGGFDFFFFLPWLMSEAASDYLFTVIPVSSTIQALKVTSRDGRHKWTFLDSMKLIPSSLDNAAKTFGCEGKLKHDLNLPESDPRWRDYLRVDCEQLYQVLTKFHHLVEKSLGGEVGITAASTAMKTYRRAYQPFGFLRHKQSHEFIREGYFGGRVEVFESKGEGLSYYDLNSSYPASMLSKMPVGVASYIPRGTPPARLTQGNHVGFVRCDITVPRDTFIPPLPVRSDGSHCAEGKLIFPTGKLSGVWDWEELQYAVQTGCKIEKCYESWWYEAQEVFADFVHSLYAFRDKARPDYNEGLAQVCKLLLNSSYGKWAMKPERRQMWRWDDPELPENAEPANGKEDSPIWYSLEETDACYIIPQISAHVTTLSRLTLLRYLHEAEKHGRVYYTDTDSIVTSSRLPSSTKLGELKDEYPTAAGRLRGQFFGPKVYLIDTEEGDISLVKSKGVRPYQIAGKQLPGESKQEYNKRVADVVLRMAAGEQVIEERLEKIGQLARAGFGRGPRVNKVPRSMKQGDSKRRLHKDGTTTPWHLKMW
jgi:hypothetical protein